MIALSGYASLSLNSYKCMEVYSLPDAASLVDFDFDESKVKPFQVHSFVKLTFKDFEVSMS